MRARLPWLLWGVAVALVIPGAVGILLTWHETMALPYVLGFALLGSGAATMGALVASRVPGNAVGWLLLAIGAGLGIMLASISYPALSSETRLGPFPAELYVAWVANWIATPVLYGLPAFLLLLFPDGRLPSRRWRWVARFVAAGVALATVAAALLPGPLEAGGGDNPVAPGGAAADFIRVFYEATDWLAPPVMVSAAAALVIRLRRSRDVERQQLKWFTYAATLACVALAASVVGPAGLSDPLFLAGLLALAGLPITAGMAILRYRLYDIDVVINRTLVYGALTVTLGAAYLASILLLQLVLSPLTQGSGLAVAGSTLAVAALFRPARARIQAIVDRRFYRHRYDAARTLEAFGARLRHELDLQALAADLHEVVHETMQPAHVSLWLRTSEMDRNDSRTADG